MDFHCILEIPLVTKGHHSKTGTIGVKCRSQVPHSHSEHVARNEELCGLKNVFCTMTRNVEPHSHSERAARNEELCGLKKTRKVETNPPAVCVLLLLGGCRWVMPTLPTGSGSALLPGVRRERLCERPADSVA